MSDYLSEEQIAKPVVNVEFFAKCPVCKEKVAKFLNNRQVQSLKCACKRDWEAMLVSHGIDPMTMKYQGRVLTYAEMLAIINGKGASP